MQTRHRTLTLALPRRRPSAWWLLVALTLAIGTALTVRPVHAQQAPSDKMLTPAELQDVVGPIALYPDDLVGIVLPASTYPLQIVEAERFLEKRKQEPNLAPSKDWDDSVVALLNYPEVVKLLNDDLDWTWDLGTAVLNQRADVLDAIQTFRTRARTAGNLRTDDHQTVTTQDDGSIAIAPANPQVIYVPYYEPESVVAYQPEPVFSYYPWAYPVYYYPYPAGYVFSTGFFWGVTSYFSIGWHSHLLHVRYYGHNDFPYYGWNYYSPYYVRNYINVNVNVPRGGYVWQPRHRYGDRPIVRGSDGRVADRRPPEPRVTHGVAGSASRYGDRNALTDTTPRSGGVAGSASRYRAPAATPNAPGSGTPRTSGERAGRQYAPGSQPGGGYRVGGGMSQSSKRNDTTQRFMATPAPRYESRSNVAPAYRVPAAPQRQPQYERAPVQREYRGMSSAPRYAPPAVRSAPPRAESWAAPSGRSELRSAPRAAGGYRGGGERAPQHGSGEHRGR
ncbi:MAG TPA: DUF3300 domain-containing protein [Gammaproteobacteria bacterium]|jgi:hypothetical protein|nr:DUF3300 domain-containing protein [Gammaproteobacteria bacterium]